MQITAPRCVQYCSMTRSQVSDMSLAQGDIMRHHATSPCLHSCALLSRALQPRLGGFLGDDGDRTLEMSRDTYKTHQGGMLETSCCAATRSLYSLNFEATTCDKLI
jgi:hypothetical protein